MAEPDWEKQYDYVYDQLDRKEIRAEKRLQYISSLSQAETSWSIPASKKQEKQLRLREKKRLVSKLQRTVNMLATDNARKKMDSILNRSQYVLNFVRCKKNDY